METFLRRAYGLRTPGEQGWDPQTSYPFWDYRCRRGSSSPETITSGSSSECTSIMTGDADDLRSYLTTSDGCEALPLRRYDVMDDSTTTSNTSETETISMCVSELGSLLENDSLLLGDAEKMVLQFMAKDDQDVNHIRELFRPLFDCIGVKQDVYFISECFENHIDNQFGTNNGFDKLSMPSLAVVVFLREEEMKGENVWDMMGKDVDKSSWRFHHTEHVSRGKLQLYENNSQDYLTARPDLPLSAMRQIHCGKKILRFLRFVSSDNWRDNVRLYGLLLGKDPEVLKQDFCLFTSSTYKDYCIQLSLKKIPKSIKCAQIKSGVLCFRVCQLGHIVPLLPNTCTPMTEDRWQTTDLDGNAIYLDVIRMRDRSCEPVPDLSDLEICDYFSDHNDCPFPVQSSNEQSANSPLQENSSLSAVVPEQMNKINPPAGKKGKSSHKKGRQNKSGTGTHGHYDDSMEELSLLIKDLAGKMEGAKANSRSLPNERDAYGTVDGASHHSEGNGEDRSCLPFNTDSLDYSQKEMADTLTIQRVDSEELSASSNSGSSHAKLTAHNIAKFSAAYRQETNRIETVSFPQKSTPQTTLQNQSHRSPYSGTNLPDRGSSPYAPSSSFSQDSFEMATGDNMKAPLKTKCKKKSSKKTKSVNFTTNYDSRDSFDERPPLPTYSEFQSRKMQMEILNNYPGYRTPIQIDDTCNDYAEDDGVLPSSRKELQQNNLYRSKSVDELEAQPKQNHLQYENSPYDSGNRSGDHQDKRQKPLNRPWQGLKVHSHPTTSQNIERFKGSPTSYNSDHSYENSREAFHNRHSSSEYQSKQKHSNVTPGRKDMCLINRNGNEPFSDNKGRSAGPPPYRPPPPPPPEKSLNYNPATPGKKVTFNKFEFNGTTVPRFGRNAKHRQSVVPPPNLLYDDPDKTVFNNSFQNKSFSNDYEELAVDVPVTKTESSACSRTIPEAPTLGFYV